MPPEYVFVARPAASVKPNRSSNSAARCLAAGRDAPSNLPSMSRFSVPVSDSSTAAYWPASAIRNRTWCACVSTSKPATLARPASGRSRVASTRTAVVLPAPLGPSIPSTAPVLATKLTSSRAAVLS